MQFVRSFIADIDIKEKEKRKHRASAPPPILLRKNTKNAPRIARTPHIARRLVGRDDRAVDEGVAAVCVIVSPRVSHAHHIPWWSKH